MVPYTGALKAFTDMALYVQWSRISVPARTKLSAQVPIDSPNLLQYLLSSFLQLHPMRFLFAIDAPIFKLNPVSSEHEIFFVFGWAHWKLTDWWRVGSVDDERCRPKADRALR